MFQVLARAIELERKGKEIVHFEIGDPDFATPDNVTQAAVEALQRGETHYTSSMGLPDFREIIREATNHSRGFKPDLSQVLVTPGANIIIYYAIRCLVDPGDEVVIPNPCFPTYLSAIRFCGAVPIFVPLKEDHQFRMQPKDVEACVTDKTRLIIMNSPHNPTGAVMSQEELDGVYDVAEKYDLYLLSDEIYARMVYEGGVQFYSPSVRDTCRERTIVTNGFSKSFAMTGWRLGCALGPAQVIEKMGLLLQTTSSCVSPFIQRAGMEAIHGDQGRVREMMKEYRSRRDLLVTGLNTLRGVRCLNPDGAFYVFPNITGTGMDDMTFARRMLDEAGVALLPGSNFGDAGVGHIRICYANSRGNISKGLERMDRLLH
jgi:aspartate/methionine/tyrosine aminotransferase